MGILRLLLAISVVAHHCGPVFGLDFVGGQVAVQSFFIMSGFYMALILHEKYIGVNNSYKLFITNRFMKLYPLYWIVLLIALFACFGKALLTHGHDMAILNNYGSVKPTIFSFMYLILTNLLIFGQDLVMFLGINPENGNLFFASDFRQTNPHLHYFLLVPQAWSLGIELTFYLIAPFILRRRTKIIILLIIISLALRFYIYNYLGLKKDPWTFRFFPTEIMFFLLGYVSYRINLIIKKKNIPLFINLLTLIAMILFTIFYYYISTIELAYIPFTINEIVYITCMVIAIPILFNFLKKNKWDNHVGELSYPIYISHVLVIMTCGSLPFVSLRAGWCILLITIILSYLLNKLIALRIEKYRQARLKKPIIANDK